jgi:hypothetical protein
MIQIIGYYPREIKTITCDIAGANGENKPHPNAKYQGYVTDRFYDKAKEKRDWDRMVLASSNRFQQLKQSSPNNKLKPWKPEQFESVFTTNYFQIYDVNLAKGKNRITIHIKDENGKQYSISKYYTLDLASDKTPPVIKLIWPQDGTEISGNEFTLKAQVDDDNATIKTIVKNSQSEKHINNAIVERNGLVWVKNLPVESGRNEVKIIATDPAGNSSTNFFTVCKSRVTVTMQPLESSQLNKSLVNVKGKVSDPDCLVKVNKIEATVHPDGTWDAENVPVSSTGTANFKIEVFKK